MEGLCQVLPRPRCVSVFLRASWALRVDACFRRVFGRTPAVRFGTTLEFSRTRRKEPRASRDSRETTEGARHEFFLPRHGNDAWRRGLPARPCQTVAARPRVHCAAIRFLPPPPGACQERSVAAVERITAARPAAGALPAALLLMDCWQRSA